MWASAPTGWYGVGTPLIRPSVRTGAPSPEGEGLGGGHGRGGRAVEGGGPCGRHFQSLPPWGKVASGVPRKPDDG